MRSRPYYYLGGRRGLTRLASGQLFIVDTDARDLATWIIHGGVWESCVDDLLGALVRPGDTFVDVGANMGYYTVKIGDRVGAAGRVFAFEPNPKLFEVLNDNVHINALSARARLFQAAAGEAAGTARLQFEPRYPGGGHLSVGDEPADAALSQVQASVLRIDDVIADGRADLIKIDVEGFEPLVLRGMAALLARSPGAAVITEVAYSHWARFGDPAQMLVQFSGERRIFWIRPDDGRIEELPKGGVDAALNRGFPSYILLLPPGPEREAQVRRFIRPYNPRTELSYTPVAPRRPSLLDRLRRRLAGY